MIFYERFEGIAEIKDRYFIVLVNSSPDVECFTTTTRNHAELKPKLASEFCYIERGECCLPKTCFVDFRKIYPFDDIQIGNRLRSGSIKQLGDMPDQLLRRLRDAFSSCRSQSAVVKLRILASLDAALRQTETSGAGDQPAEPAR